MSVLFTPRSIGDVRIKNRFISSACEDNLSTDSGEITDAAVRKNRNLARGGAGLIIGSHLFVHPLGRTKIYQPGIHRDEMIPGLKKVAEAVHREDGRIVFQIGHGGTQTSEEITGQQPMGPATMDEARILEVIEAFRDSAGRAVEAGADGVQLHAAHGYLLSQFLSPFFNRREDRWGGSDENRFRLVREIISEIKKILPRGMPLLIKMNTDDHTRREGMNPALAATYAGWLKDLMIDGLEVSCGTSFGSPWNMCRGDVPVNEIVQSFPEDKRPRMEAYFTEMAGRFDLRGPYNLEAAKMIRPVFGDIPLFAVGGWREKHEMEDAVEKGYTDFISMCRPFIRQPDLVKRFQEGRTDTASCKNCNRCLAALANDIPVRCYYRSFPE